MSLAVKDMIRMGEIQLMDANCMNPKVDAEALYMFMMNIDRTRFFMQWGEDAEDRVCEEFFGLIERRVKREPLQHIMGYQDFMGIRIEVNSNVLIPRPETEMLVEEAVKIIMAKNPKPKKLPEDADFFMRIASRKNWKVLDLCCGSGAIGISVAHRCMNTKVTATDISPEAIELAKKNAAKNRVKIDFKESDLFGAVQKKSYDMIISNPPYIKTHMIPILQEEVKNYEPLTALDGGADGLDFYKRIIAEAPQHLRPQGVLLLEIGDEQGADIQKLIEENEAFQESYLMKDYNNHDRIVIAKI